jgi:hypothetical protein
VRRRAGAAAALAAVIATTVTASASSSSGLLPPRLVPNAVAFSDRLHGVLGTGWENCGFNDSHCRAEGTIALTSDGGKTWRVVRRTPRPVVALTRNGGAYQAKYDDGETLRSGNGRIWRPTSLATADINTQFSVCPQGTTIGLNSGATDWSLCTGEPGAGNQGKAVYRDTARGWRRVACTWFGTSCRRGNGGISSYGYPTGIAANDDGFGIIWESRGTLYVTRSGGRHWVGLPKLSLPEVDFGSWAYVLPHGGVGFALLFRGGGGAERLLETTDAGRTWRVVHRWPAPSR